MFVIVKIILSGIVIGIVTEISRRFPTYGGIVSALPLISLLSILWLYVQGEQIPTLIKFTSGVLYGLPGTAVILLIVYISLKHSASLSLSIGFGISGWLVFLFVQRYIIKFFEISFLK